MKRKQPKSRQQHWTNFVAWFVEPTRVRNCVIVAWFWPIDSLESNLINKHDVECKSFHFQFFIFFNFWRVVWGENIMHTIHTSKRYQIWWSHVTHNHLYWIYTSLLYTYVLIWCHMFICLFFFFLLATLSWKSTGSFKKILHVTWELRFG